MAQTPGPATQGIHSVDLAIETSKSIFQIAKLLKGRQTSKDLKRFYGHLMVHCIFVTDHVNHLKSVLGPENNFITRVLDLFESLISGRVAPEGLTHMHSRQRALNQRWDILRSRESDARLEFVEQCLNVVQPPELRPGQEFGDAFDAWEEEVVAAYREDGSQRLTDDRPPKKARDEPSYFVWSAARLLFKALANSTKCECTPEHMVDATLCLGTYRQPGLDDTNDFDMFLSLQQDWQEVHVYAVRDSVVRFVVNDAMPPPKRKKLDYNPKLVEKLCGLIQDQERRMLKRLELKVERGQLLKLRSQKSAASIDSVNPTVSLRQFIEEGSRFLTEKTKRILAVLLSYAVLHLHGTPWLQPTWDSSKILFFRTTSSSIPLRPFIQTQLGYEYIDFIAPEQDDHDPDDIEHPFPALVTLATMLMELSMATPFQELAKNRGFSLPEGLDNRTRFLEVASIFDEYEREIPQNSQFYYTIKKCLDPRIWEDEWGQKMDDEVLRVAIYREVVRPLEDELCDAFSFITIEELDEIAENVDAGSWGQTIQNHYTERPPKETLSPPIDGAWPQRCQYFNGSQTSFQNPPFVTGHWYTPEEPRPFPGLGQQFARESAYKFAKFYDGEKPSEGHSHTKYVYGNISLFNHLIFLLFPLHPRNLSILSRRSPNTAAGFIDVESPRVEGYLSWKAKYKAVYRKFIEQYLQEPQKSAVKIAVLDSGVDDTHNSLDTGQIITKRNWTSAKFKKAAHDRDGHGTFIASLLIDYAPDAELYIAKIAEKELSPPQIIAEAIKTAVDDWKVDIISMSFGYPTNQIDGYEELEKALLYAHSKNVLMFAAASNNGANLDRAYPARDPHVICIHSTDSEGNRSKFSPTALSRDANLATIGEAVQSAWPVNLCDPRANPDCVQCKSGTSYAAPIAVGIAAFLLQYARLHLADQADMLKRQSKMKEVLLRIAEKTQKSISRDDYHYIALSLYSDNLFGKGKQFIDVTLAEILKR